MIINSNTELSEVTAKCAIDKGRRERKAEGNGSQLKTKKVKRSSE